MFTTSCHGIKAFVYFMPSVVLFISLSFSFNVQWHVACTNNKIKSFYVTVLSNKWSEREIISAINNSFLYGFPIFPFDNFFTSMGISILLKLFQIIRFSMTIMNSKTSRVRGTKHYFSNCFNNRLE